MTFNFMFEFINRAASMSEPVTVEGLDELMPYGNWRTRLTQSEKSAGRPLTPDERKEILVAAFSENLAQLGGYQYVVSTEILRPLRDRTLYCLFYATRHESGIAAFRDCQIKALNAQATTRAALKVQHEASGSGQAEFFESLHDMGPDKTATLLAEEKRKAAALVLKLTPKSPDHISYRQLWAVVLTRHVVTLTHVNALCADLRKKKEIVFLDWETGKRVPKDHYRAQRPDTGS